MPLSRPSMLRFCVLSAHLAFSALLLAVLSLWVVTRWYPGGLLALQGGVPILLWVGAVTLVLGPLLTLILFRPDKKGARELALDLALILVLQLCAFGYGTWVLSVQRPTYLVFLFDRFFVITPQDVVGAVPAEVEAVAPWSNGPRPVFVKLSLGAQLDAARSVAGMLEAPPMALLPGSYAPLREGRSRFEQMRDSGEATPAEKNGTLWAPIIGRAGHARAAVDIESGTLLRIEQP